MSDVASELRRQFAAVIEAHPDLQCRWEERDRITFPAVDPAGFDVSVLAAGDSLIVFAGTVVHVHFEEPPEVAARDALGLARDLLSPDMRLRERCAGDRVYRGILERRTERGWAAEASTRLLLWNWFGRRSERVYRNSQMPGRLLVAPPQPQVPAADL